MDIYAVQGDKRIPLAAKTYPGGILQVQEDVPLDAGTMQEGQFTIEVTARDASSTPFGPAGMSKAEKTYSLGPDPAAHLCGIPGQQPDQGGAGLMIYALSEEAAKTGIQVGETVLPGLSATR